MAMREAFSRSSHLVGSMVGNLLFQLVRNKLLALVLGPAGVGWIALVNNLVETTATITGGGVGDALNREMARRKPKFTHAQIFSTGVGIVLLLFAVASPAVAIALSILVPSNMAFGILLTGVIIAISGATAWRVLAGLFLGLGMAKTMAAATLVGAFANLLLTAVLLALGVTDPLAFVVLSPTCVAVCGVIAARTPLSDFLSRHWVKNAPARGPILAIALPVSIGLLLEPLTALYVRSAVGMRLDEAAIGLLQPGFLFVLLAASVFNAIAGITIVRWDQSEEAGFSRPYLIMLGAAVVLPASAMLLILLLKPIFPSLISLFFSDQFRSGAEVMAWLLAGEAFRMGGALFLFTFLSRKLGYFSLIPRAAGLATAIAIIELSDQFGLVLAGQSYAAAFAVSFVISMVLWLGLQFRLSLARNP